jgi:excisionase family DNA binding protein
MVETSIAWWRVPQLAQLLRVHPDTIYDAIASGTLPAKKVANFYVVPSEAIGLRVRPDTMTRNYHQTAIDADCGQLELELDPRCLVPIKLYRDGLPRNPWDYEHQLWNVTV